VVDVDGVRRAASALRESEERFELLANSAPVLIWMNDLEGLRSVNRAFEEYVGSTETEIRASGVARYVHPDDRHAYTTAYSDAIRDKKPFQARFRFRRADGEYRWMKALGTPRFVAEGQLAGYVGSTFDVTDMKEAESALIDLDRGKNEFLAMLAHELRNPLAGVRNATRLLGETTDPPVLTQARDIIERQTGHMVRMVEDLLDVSRITHGKIELRLETTDLGEALRRALDATQADRAAASLELETDIPREPIWVRGDPMRLEQVFTNLLNNATKFTRSGGRVWVTAALESARSRGGETHVVIRVRDNGAGIDPAVLPRIFDLFVQSDRTVDRARTGIGLGLTLARRLVDLHGGSIEAVSAGNALGSEFTVRLPLLGEGEQASAPRPRKAAARTRAKATARRVLIIDDNADSAESLRMLLDVAGHDVRIVAEGGLAVDAAREFKPEVILLDIGLPDIDGYEVSRRLNATPAGRAAHIVAITGYAGADEARRSREAGIDAHLTKPIDPDTLSDVLAPGTRRAEAD
jgi:PAS domain S-box-containing protein